MNILLIFPGFIVAFIIVFCYERKITRMRNKVHFYVARDKNGELWLYIGKPIRIDDQFSHYPPEGIKALAYNSSLKIYGLNENDYANLKWEDEPVEVFVNTEN